MREATDLGVSAGVRRELSGRRIDLTKLKFPVKNGVITIEGELSFVGIEKSSDETAIELKFLESSLKAINGAKEINFALTNWTKNEAGVWESIGARPASASTPSASGEGLYCPDCDFVIRFCPCCGKPLAGAGKNAPSKTRRPVPPIKPLIKKKRPVAPFIAPARPVETDQNEAPVIPVAPVKPAVAPAQPVVAPIKPAPAATPTVSPEPAKLEPAAPVKPAMPTISKPVMPAQPVPPAPEIPAAMPVAPAVPVKPVTPAAPPTVPEDINKAIDSWNLDPVPLDADAEDNEASPFPELFNPEAEKPAPAPIAPQPAPTITPVRPAAPAMPATPAKPAAPLPPTEPVAPVMPATPVAPVAPVAPVSPVSPSDSSMPDLSDFDANAFDLSQASPTADSSTNNSSADVPNLDQLDISAFVTPEIKEPEAPKAAPAFDLGVDLGQDQGETLTTTPASIDDRCDFSTPNAPAPLDSPFDLDDETPLPPMKPDAVAASPFDLDDDTPLPPMKPAAPADPFDLDDTPLPPMKPAAPPAADPFDLDDETPLPPMKPAGQAKPASKDPFAALFTDAGSDLSSPDGAKGKDPFAALDLDLDVLEVFPSNNSEPAPPPPAKPGAPAAAKPVDDNPFNLDNVIDLDSPVEDNKKGQKDPFDLDDFDISKFKI